MAANRLPTTSIKAKGLFSLLVANLVNRFCEWRKRRRYEQNELRVNLDSRYYS